MIMEIVIIKQLLQPWFQLGLEAQWIHNKFTYIYKSQ